MQHAQIAPLSTKTQTHPRPAVAPPPVVQPYVLYLCANARVRACSIAPICAAAGAVHARLIVTRGAASGGAQGRGRTGSSFSGSAMNQSDDNQSIACVAAWGANRQSPRSKQTEQGFGGANTCLRPCAQSLLIVPPNRVPRGICFSRPDGTSFQPAQERRYQGALDCRRPSHCSSGEFESKNLNRFHTSFLPEFTVNRHRPLLGNRLALASNDTQTPSSDPLPLASSPSFSLTSPPPPRLRLSPRPVPSSSSSTRMGR